MVDIMEFPSNEFLWWRKLKFGTTVLQFLLKVHIFCHNILSAFCKTTHLALITPSLPEMHT